MENEDLFPSRRISAFKGDFARSGSFLHASASLLFSQGFLLLSCALAAYAVHPEDVYVEETQNRPSRLRAGGPPAPYSFVYDSSTKDGSHSREETRDEQGTVRGSYRIMLADGRMRVVKYVADKDGFRAGIATNEQGTESATSSGVVVHSQALTGPEAARAAAHRSRTPSHRAPPSKHAAAASSNVEQRVLAPWREEYVDNPDVVFFRP